MSTALSLSNEQAHVLERIPENGKVPIAHVLRIALDLERSMAAIAADIKALVVFGIQAPSASDTYLGVSWQHLVSAEVEQPTG